MITKYWYEEGMCKYMQYKGLWPVAYTSEDGNIYKKSCMACRNIENGSCKLGNECDVYKIAADEIEKHWDLRDKKMS